MDKDKTGQIDKTSAGVLMALMWALVLLLPITKIADFDLFFHLRLGERLVETGSLYRLDEFTYTAPGSPQYLLEWLSNGAIYVFYKLMGYPGLGLMKAALFGLVVFTLTRTFQWSPIGDSDKGPIGDSDKGPIGDTKKSPTGAIGAATALTVLVFAYSMRFRLDLRPYYFTYLFVAVYMYAFIRYKAGANGGGRDARVLYALVPVQVLWANTHGGMVLGPPLLTLFVAAEAARKRQWPPAGELLAVALLWAAPVLGPAQYGPFGVLFSVATGGSDATLGVLGEWQGLSAELLWGHGLRYTLGFQLLVLGAFVTLARDAFNKRFDPFELALFAGSVYYSFSHTRLIAVSSILLAPIFFRTALWAASRVLKPIKSPSAMNWALSAAVGYLMIFSVIGSGLYDFGFGKKEGVFPDGALRFLDDNSVGGRGFNTVTVGSYMLWAAPGRKVLIDGRLNVPSDVHKGYEEAIKSAEGFRSLDRRWGFNYLLVDYGPMVRWRFPLHLGGSPDWAPVYWDSTAVVYLKNTPANSSLISRFGYRLLRPSFDDFRYLDHYIKGRGAAEALRAVDSDIARNPKLQDARLAKAFVAYYLGKRDVARAELELALTLEPDIPFEHISLAQLYIEAGKTDAARRHLKHALKLSPSNSTAKELLKKLKKR